MEEKREWEDFTVFLPDPAPSSTLQHGEKPTVLSLAPSVPVPFAHHCKLPPPPFSLRHHPTATIIFVFLFYYPTDHHTDSHLFITPPETKMTITLHKDAHKNPTKTPIPSVTPLSLLFHAQSTQDNPIKNQKNSLALLSSSLNAPEIPHPISPLPQRTRTILLSAKPSQPPLQQPAGHGSSLNRKLIPA